MDGNIVDAARFIGAGLAMIGAAGAGIGIGLSVQGALEGMSRNPDTYGNLLTNMILGIAFSDIKVAEFMTNLSGASGLISTVDLVESANATVEQVQVKRFSITVELKEPKG